MKLIELKCKNCGTILKVNLELNEIFCNYCENKMIIDDEATNIDRIENANLKSSLKSSIIYYGSEEQI